MPQDILILTPPTLSLADYKAAYAATYTQQVNQFVSQVVSNFRALNASLFASDANLTPAQKVAALGDKGKSVFERAAAFKVFLVAQGIPADQIPGVPTRYTLTINEDGTATLADAQ